MIVALSMLAVLLVAVLAAACCAVRSFEHVLDDLFCGEDDE